MADLQTCIDIIVAKSGNRLTPEQAAKVLNREDEIRARIIAKGYVDDLENRVAEAVAREGLAAKKAATLVRKRAAQNALVRDARTADQRALEAQGLAPDRALNALIDGTQIGVRGGRVSAMSKAEAWVSRIGEGPVFAAMEKERPHIKGLLQNKEFDTAVTKELYELREGGTPGSTKNSDAQWLAKQLAMIMEEGRIGANKHGADIGFLPGYAGPQVHDDLLAMRAGQDKWMADIKPLLDLDRSFPEVTSEEELNGILGEIWKSVVSGLHSGLNAQVRGTFLGPFNIGKRLSRSRILHFKDADSAIQYRDLYGRGSTIGLIFSHQRRLGHLIGAMEQFGPNPEVMVHSLAAKKQVALRAQLAKGGDDKAIAKMIEKMTPENFQTGIDIMTGAASVPQSTGAVATIAAGYRGWKNLTSLGGAVLPSISGDTMTAAVAAMLRGQGFWNGFINQMTGLFEHVGNARAREIAYLWGQAMDGYTGHLTHSAVATDVAPGTIANLTHGFFKWSGLTGWTDASRGTATRVVLAHLGMNFDKSFDKLEPRFQHNLAVNGIDGASWDAIRQGATVEVNGNRYIVPDSIRNLGDDQIKSLVGPVKPNKLPAALKNAREALEMQLRSYVADEVNYGVLTVDAATRRYTTGGFRPGTLPGEVIRSVMQFKGFPAAFTQRVIGRGLFGGPGATSRERFINNLPHLGVMIAAMTGAGYIALLMKDAAKGLWPPRDPFSVATLGNALVAGGGLGVYGDLLFGNAYTYNKSGLITAAGPTAGTAADIYNIWLKAVGSTENALGVTVPSEQQLRAMDLLNFGLDNTPYANLFYLRSAMDILWVNALREYFSPGYLRRQEQKREQYTGQHYALPRTLEEVTR